MNIRLEIMLANYWEHFKISKDLSLIYPVDHPRRKEVETSMAELQAEIHKLETELKDADIK